MTTIAVRIDKNGAEMASDSQMTRSHIMPTHCTKVVRIGDHLVGIAGCAAACMDFMRWYEKGAKRKKFPESCEDDESGCYALVLTGKKALLYQATATPIDAGKMAALGSGQDFAIAALLCGKSAADAVRIAAKLDPFTGGPVRTRRIEL